MQIHFNQFPDYQHGVEEFANQQLQKLEKFGIPIEKAEVFYRHTASPDKPHEVEIKLAIPGQDLFAREGSDSFQKAFALCGDKLASQLSHRKRTGRQH